MSGSQPAGRRNAARGGGGRNSNNSFGGGRSSSRGGGGVIGQRRGNPPRQGYGGRQARNRPPVEEKPGPRDEDILIAFMPYLKGNHDEALRIHEEYQAGNDQKAFLKAARDFLARENAPIKGNSSTPLSSTSGQPAPVAAPPAHIPAPASSSSTPSGISLQQQSLQQQLTQQTYSAAPPHHQQQQRNQPDPRYLSEDSSELPSSALFEISSKTPQAHLLFPPSASTAQTSVSSNFHPLATSQPIHISRSRLPAPEMQHLRNPLYAQDDLNHTHGLDSHRDVSLDGLRMNSIERGLDALMDEDTFLMQSISEALRSEQQQQEQRLQRSSDTIQRVAAPQREDPFVPMPPVRRATTAPLPITPPRNTANQHPKQGHLGSTPDQGSMSPWGYGTPVETSSILGTSPAAPPAGYIGKSNGTNGSADAQTPTKSNKETIEPYRAPTTTVLKKEAPPPKRLWTHPEEQPGKILVKGHSGEDYSVVLYFAPREELHAHWGISLAYLRTYAAEKYGPDASLETVLSKMTLGLFRRGCTENGMQASIVSKSVLGDFWKDPPSQSVRGKVPFYSPRTPGHVVFRLFWEDDPLYTLASGPAILVRVVESDFESSIRFILSNFKGKKSNPTSLSSLHSLATILETQITRPNESAARAAWGCIQEARKVLETCAQEHEKTTAKLAALEESVDELKKQVDSELEEAGVASEGADVDDNNSADGLLSEAAQSLKEKTRALMSGRASCERKWRDSQLAFAGILRAVVMNQSMAVLLRRDLIAKMRIEYEIWCPLSEEFAIPGDNPNVRMWYEPLRDLPQNVTADDFSHFAQARVKMQLRTLGFDPNTLPLEDILFPRNPNSPTQRAMDPGAVNVFNSLSSAMGQMFQELFRDEEVVTRRREMIRKRTEECVQESGVFPPGTQVVIFGSSANGFGSPKSDLDMCLQLPEGMKLDDQDSNGAISMSKLGEYLEKSGGMTNVDTARLTARIPIIMYRCPDPLSSSEGDGGYVECDLSMHNPLAVLNTSLLRTYAEITPITRVLSTIIKRWAKARDINNPARHTLSSYGYIIMLLHFLTYHKRTGNGLVSPVAPAEGDPSHRHQGAQRPSPLLPNLQWMDPTWLNTPRGTPYREMAALPRTIVAHPLEEGKRVNRYFYKPGTPNEVARLQLQFPGHDLSLAILLASFFRYYAYEFDYKRYVVSLHSTSSRGLMEREVKAELDGWRNYSAALTIEDPFETFYDVAHVLRGGYYHRIRREFAVAYSKIADAVGGRQGSWNKGDLRKMTGDELIEWICEPIEKEKGEIQ